MLLRKLEKELILRGAHDEEAFGGCVLLYSSPHANVRYLKLEPMMVKIDKVQG